MRRREFIAGLGAAAAWAAEAGAQAQQGERVRRIGVLIGGAESDPNYRSWFAAFIRQLQQLGWSEGRNVRIDTRWGAGDTERMRTLAAELVALGPDVLFGPDTPSLAMLRQATSSIPIVFAVIADPIGGGFVASLARPGGNVTGFIPVEPPLAGRWVELLKEVAPQLRRLAVLHNPDTAPYTGAFIGYATTAAATHRIDVIAAAVRSSGEIENTLSTLGLNTDTGLIVMPEVFTALHLRRIIDLATAHRLPAIYPYRYFVDAGGLICYGNNFARNFQLAAGYVDRILKGEKPADLPVQAPTKFELIINLKAAKTIGLAIPEAFLLRADEVIE